MSWYLLNYKNQTAIHLKNKVDKDNVEWLISSEIDLLIRCGWRVHHHYHQTDKYPTNYVDRKESF